MVGAMIKLSIRLRNYWNKSFLTLWDGNHLSLAVKKFIHKSSKRCEVYPDYANKR